MKNSKVLAFCAAALAAAACAAPKPAAPASALPPAPSSGSAPAASAGPAPAAPAAMPSGKLKRAGGTVVSVDAAASTLTIKDYSGRTRVFRIAAGAAVTKGGDDSAIALSDLAAGDRVRLKVGGDVAGSVHVLVRTAP